MKYRKDGTSVQIKYLVVMQHLGQEKQYHNVSAHKLLKLQVKQT